jgi:hypothetical protein
MTGTMSFSASSLLVIVASVLMASAVSAQTLSLEQLRDTRRELAHTPRRIIANNDGCDCLYFPRNIELTVQSFLDRRTTGLVGSQVDTINYCSISSGFSNFTHYTKLGTVLTRESADYGILPKMRNVSQDLIDLDSDCLQSVVQFGHANDLEVFWSMRMNDTHDVAHTPEKPYLLYPPLKVEHPEWLISDHIKRTPQGRWSSVNYALPEIRDLAFGYIDEVCRNYDVDGIELDFFRHLCYFASVANGGVASQEELDMMTDLMQRIRAMTEEVGRERGRPILVAIRVPDSVEFSRDMGFDLERWMSEGLVDILITTGYFNLNPWEYTVELAHRYDVAAYPCLADSRVRGESRFRRASIESYRGRAMNAWFAGADGIHTFNLFHPTSAIFREIGDPAGMATMDKLYFATVRDGNPNSWLAGGDSYRTVPILTPSNPKGLALGAPLEVDIVIGEDFEGAAAKPDVVLHTQIPGIKRAERVRVTLNDHELGDATVADGWLDYRLALEWLKRGANRVKIELVAEEMPAADEWSLVWDAADGELPKAPWYRDPGSVRTEEKLDGGALFIADRGEVSGDYHYYRWAWGWRPGEPVTVEARVKAVAGGSFLIIGDGVTHERLGFWPDRIELYMHKDISFEMDTTDDFHTYRIESEGEDLKVYVDGELRLDGTGTLTPQGRTSNQLAFGAANSGMVGEAYWSQVRARTVSLGCRDLLISVTYP